MEYQGQQEKEAYVQATILLDGADTTMMVAHLYGIAIADVHSGLRVQAIWAPEAERGGATGSLARQMGLGSAVTSWEATGEPDLPRDHFAEHIVGGRPRDARRRDRLLRAAPARAAARPARDADAAPDDHARARRRRADPAGRRVHVLGQRRLPHRRHVHVRANARSGRRVAAD